MGKLSSSLIESDASELQGGKQQAVVGTASARRASLPFVLREQDKVTLLLVDPIEFQPDQCLIVMPTPTEGTWRCHPDSRLCLIFFVIYDSAINIAGNVVVL